MKKRILTVALVLALLAVCFAGTYAYLTDTKAQKNTFTTGNVYITLDEAKVDGTGRISETQDYKLFPAMTVTKDPTITLDSNSEDAWVAAKVTVSAQVVNEKGLYDLLGIAGTDMIDINVVAKGGLIGDGTVAPVATTWKGLNGHEINGAFIYQVADKANNTWTLYIFMKDAQTKTSEPVVLFETLTVPSAWDNAEMDVIDTLEINVQAFAAQKYGFGDCFTAMTTAFKTAFPFATNP